MFRLELVLFAGLKTSFEILRRSSRFERYIAKKKIYAGKKNETNQIGIKHFNFTI